MLRTSRSLDTTFSALSDPTRRAILSRLARGEVSVMDLAQPFRMSLPAVSKHVGILEKAGLLVRKKKGRVHHCTLVATPMREAAEWMARYRRFWEQRLDALAAYLNQSLQEEQKLWKKENRNTRSRSGASSKHRAKKSSGRGPNRSR